MSRRIGLLSTLIVLLWTSVTVHAQTAPSPAHSTLEALQRQIVATRDCDGELPGVAIDLSEQLPF